MQMYYLNINCEIFFLPLQYNLYTIMENNTSPVFDNNTVEFVTVAAQVCAYLEQVTDYRRDDFLDTTLKLLPLLYLKASMLPICERLDDDVLEHFVTESDYEYLRKSIATLMGTYDDYLETFLDDMAFSDMPIRQTISENLADIYQVVKDFLNVFQLGYQPTMHEALAECRALFCEFWGQRLVNVMRALHQVRYMRTDEDDSETDNNSFFDEQITEEELYAGLDMGDEED